MTKLKVALNYSVKFNHYNRFFQKVKLGLNESLEFCSKLGLGLLTNRDPSSYNTLVELENVDRSG